MDAWTLSSRSTLVRPRFDSLRDHADIKTFLERRRKSSIVPEINLQTSSQEKRSGRDSLSPAEGPEQEPSPDTGYVSRRGSIPSQVLNWNSTDSRRESEADARRESGDGLTPPAYRASYRRASEMSVGGNEAVVNKSQHHHHHRKKKGKVYRMLWLVTCLLGTFAHFFLTTLSYMKYETATETVIGMPLEVKVPATAVCFPIWSMIKTEMLPNNSACFNVTTSQEIDDCEAELFGQHHTVFYVLHILTRDVVDLIDFIEIRKPSKTVQWIRDEDLYDVSPERRYRKNQTVIRTYYKGPDKCVSFHPISQNREKDPEQLLSVDRMTTAKSRIFFTGTFRVNPSVTPDIFVVRLYAHETDSYPHGSVTLPVVANLTKGLSFTISYTKIETTYLPAPFFSKCVDYNLVSASMRGEKLQSKQHCTAKCVRRRTKADPFNPTIPADHLLTRDISTLTHFEMSEVKFMPSDSESVGEVEQECTEMCSLDCQTKNFYTVLSESELSHSEDFLQIKTRFENPETSVKFIPKLDFEAYIIYVAGVFSIWFSASVYHMVKGSVSSFCDAVIVTRKRLFQIRRLKDKTRTRNSSQDLNNNRIPS